MNIYKLIFLSLIFFTSIFFSNTFAKEDNVSIVAIINGIPLTNYDIKNYTNLILFNLNLKPTERNYKRVMEANQVLRFAISQTLQQDKLNTTHVSTTPSEIKSAITTFLKSKHISAKELGKKLTLYHLQKAFLYKSINVQASWEKYIALASRQLIHITSLDIEQKKQEYTRMAHEPLKHVYMIFLPIYGSNDIPKIQRNIEQIYTHLRKGNSFIKISKQYLPPNNKNKNDMGWVQPMQLPAQIANVIERLRVKQVSAPIRTPDGVYIFYVNAEKPATDIKVPTDNQVRNLLIQQELNQISLTQIAQLWTDSYIRLFDSSTSAQS